MRTIVLLVLLSAGADAQSVQLLNTPTKASLRGITVVDAKTVWISGDGGAVLRTTDAGATWTSVNPPNAADLDFRDVEAFNADVAYTMSSGPGTRSRIFKTSDGGKTWKQQFITFDPRYFFDCFAFWNPEHGIAIGDPIGNHFSMLETHDGGGHWTVVTSLPQIIDSEAAFSTGTCIVTSRENDIWFGTGSKQGARVFHSADHGRTWSAVSTPMMAEDVGEGIFSMAFANPQVGIIVGGNYQKPEKIKVNAAYTINGGKTWMATPQQPAGYRCGVAFRPGTDGNTIITVGTTGVDISLDRGAHWRSLTGERYHSVAFAPDGSAAYILGQNGRVARINFTTAAPRK